MRNEYWIVLNCRRLFNQSDGEELMLLERIHDFLSDNFVTNKKAPNMISINMTSTVTKVLGDVRMRESFFSDFNDEKLDFSSCHNSSKHDLEENNVTGASKLVERIRRGIAENDDVIISFGITISKTLEIRKELQEKFYVHSSYGISYTEEIATFVSDRHGNNSVTVMLPEEFENVYGVIEINGFKKIKESVRNDLIGRFGVRTLNDVLSIKYRDLHFHFPTKVVDKILEAARGENNRNQVSKYSHLCSKHYRKTPVHSFTDVKGILESLGSDIEKKVDREKRIRKLVPKKFYLKFGTRPTKLTKYYVNVPLDSDRNCLTENSLKKFKTLMKGKDLGKLNLMYFELGGESLEDTSLNVPITNFFRPTNCASVVSSNVSETARNMSKERRQEIDEMNNLTEVNE
uniref:DNA polymerase eta (inferred by orthology to a human protein) n=1 Tax=Strongyloides venezuelensis TaxID=75913 RepID=A0A0K0F8F0_STRVS